MRKCSLIKSNNYNDYTNEEEKDYDNNSDDNDFTSFSHKCIMQSLINI